MIYSSKIGYFLFLGEKFGRDRNDIIITHNLAHNESIDCKTHWISNSNNNSDDIKVEKYVDLGARIIFEPIAVET